MTPNPPASMNTAPNLSELASSLHARALQHHDEVQRLFADLVSARSLSGEEEEAARIVEAGMKAAGFDEVRIDAMGNVLGRIGDGPTTILMDAHIDTVDVGDPSEWTDFPPYPATVRDGVVHGRGASDQKCGAAALVEGGRLIKEFGLDAGCTIWVCATCMEEDSDGIALLQIIGKEGIKPDFCVLTDSTDLNVYRGQRGRMEILVEVKGRSCHGSMPHLGDNALTKAAAIITEIDALNDRLADDAFLGKGTIVVSHLETKTPSLCAVPGEAIISIDRRLTAGETPEGAMDELRALPSVRAADAKVSLRQYEKRCWTGAMAGQEKYYPSWVFDEEDPVVQSALDAASAAKGAPQRAGRWNFSTNGVACAGRLGIPSVGFGPGPEELAHTAKEYCSVQDVLTAAVFYALYPTTLSHRLGASKAGGPAS